jgi:hypothetical protein
VLLIARPPNEFRWFHQFPVERVEACGKTVPVVGRTIAKFMTTDPVKQQTSLHGHRASLFQTAHADRLKILTGVILGRVGHRPVDRGQALELFECIPDSLA